MQRRNILLWHWGRRGGGPRYTLELTKALKENEALNIHLSLSRQSEIFGECAELSLPSFNIDTYSDLPSAMLRSIRLPLIRRQFWNYVNKNNIALIVCTMSHLWNVPVLMGARRNIPYLCVLHDALPHPGDDVMLRHWLLKREVGYADGVVTLTEHVRRLLCEEYSYLKPRSWVVPHGVFPYANRLSKAQGNTIRLLFFGRILPYKGLDLLLDAYRIMQQENCPVSLSIIGAGDLAPYKEKLRGLSNVTIENRWIAEDEIGAIFENADISVSPYREASQSGVIAVSYAAGVPAVVTPVGGLVEQVKHEETGLISRDTSPIAIADALRRMVSEPELLARCRKGAAQEAKALSWPAIASRFAEVCEQMIAMGRR